MLRCCSVDTKIIRVVHPSHASLLLPNLLSPDTTLFSPISSLVINCQTVSYRKITNHNVDVGYSTNRTSLAPKKSQPLERSPIIGPLFPTYLRRFGITMPLIVT